MKFPGKKHQLAEIFNTFYRQKTMHEVHAATNLPYSENPNDDLLEMFIPVSMYISSKYTYVDGSEGKPGNLEILYIEIKNCR